MGLILGLLIFPFSGLGSVITSEVSEEGSLTNHTIDRPSRRMSKKPKEYSVQKVTVQDIGFLSGLDRQDNLLVVPAELIEELSLQANIRSFDSDIFSGSEKVEQYLEITHEEKSTISKAWVIAQNGVKKLAVQSAMSENLADGSVKIEIPEVTNDTNTLSNTFFAVVKSTLGENRGNAFLAINQVSRLFSQSLGARIYTVKMEEIGDGGWRYHMTLEHAGHRKVWIGDNIPKDIRHITNLARIIPDLNIPASQ